MDGLLDSFLSHGHAVQQVVAKINVTVFVLLFFKVINVINDASKIETRLRLEACGDHRRVTGCYVHTSLSASFVTVALISSPSLLYVGACVCVVLCTGVLGCL